MGETQSAQGQPGMEWLPFARPIMFRRPGYLQPSAWLEHLPFAMWVVDAHRPATLVELGTHHGPSYFGFCQAVAELGLDTSCYAVDTWQGDEHAGFYGQDVYEKVRSYNDANYSGFSRLVRSTFDEAASHFSDGSVDLLHIDGLHTLEAVTHDFESWKPKLSDRAVVLFHDINVRERGFGVFKLFEQLREQYPAFWFVHGHGLGVLGVGPNQSESLRRLYALGDGDGRTLTSVREIFARLGRACADAFERGDVRTKLLDAQSQLKTSHAALEQTRHRMGQVERAANMSDLHRERVKDVASIAAAERGRLLEQLASANARLEELEKAQSQVRELMQEVESNQVRAERVAQLQGEIDARFEEIALLTRRLLDAEQGLAKADSVSKRREAHLERLELDGGVRMLNRIRRLLRRKPLALRRDPREEDIEVIRAAAALDAQWYAGAYPDVAAGGVDPVVHYVMFGADEGRDPSADFSTRGYLERYPDVREGGLNPLAHYLLHGKGEGRNTTPVEAGR
ncbi:class I SAM-dependent methyltransferase [Alkalisalibacterium limincola]|uniref:Class I SAM-dependent methyltransferase n=1 Tax=Alkalisalibacterium limincola TaxID=2699169 RepID=A0A5C8KKN1_9GAMM|nr:class I SAM-dependent methyltransferase [Alkalisalibacterium limincola]TXK59852.1 hypothetical protein FU658_12980 [Alkalisalibacterium limincola]